MTIPKAVLAAFFAGITVCSFAQASPPPVETCGIPEELSATAVTPGSFSKYETTSSAEVLIKGRAVPLTTDQVQIVAAAQIANKEVCYSEGTQPSETYNGTQFARVIKIRLK
jgi:hypothetical protein